jgi:hypothetical protein
MNGVHPAVFPRHLIEHDFSRPQVGHALPGFVDHLPERCLRRLSWVREPEERFKTADVSVNGLVGEQAFGRVLPFPNGAGLESVETDYQPEPVMGEDAPAEQVDGA